ncbi:MAG: biosynthetic-type acetolactate synthase large subunit [Clostridium sp.]|jgi:acetolactate synthase-1/2/3 large subunit|nr:biosynthetic-type acetolactate synthase large subunit [Clostridium sp.]
MKRNGARILIDTLVDLGVKTVFGYPGGAVLNIYDELYLNSERIAHVLAAHEQGAAHAADGYARVTGKPGVVISTSGPGATNLVTGIANAYLDSVPMLAITGNVSIPLLGRDSFQEVDIVGITQPIVKHSYMVRRTEDLERTIREAYALALSGRPGPVLVDIPKSVQIDEAESVPYSKDDSGALPNPAALPEFAKCLELIRACERPCLYLGGGVMQANEQAIALAEKIGAPITLSLMGLAAVPHSHPLNLGMSGMHGQYAASMAQSRADLLIACGVRFSDRATGNTEKFAKNRAIIHIDIDEAEFGKNVAPGVALHGELSAALSALLAAAPQKNNAAWLAELEEYKKISAAQSEMELNPASVIRTVHDCIEDDGAIVATDVGQHQMWVAQHYPFEKPRTLLTSGGLGTMGFGLGAAIGGCVAAGKKRTVLFTSDGSFGMNLNELATAVSQGLPIVIILLNNGVLGMVRQWQAAFYGQRFSQTTLGRKTDFVALTKSFGGVAQRIGSLAELREALKNLPGDCPALIECPIDPDERVLPMIPPGGSIENIILN